MLLDFSIYKSVLKSKGSISEVNQIAQVCSDISFIHFDLWNENFLMVYFCLLTRFLVCYKKLRIIIKPKPSVGVGPLFNPQQVTFVPMKNYLVVLECICTWVTCIFLVQICYHVLGLVHGIWTPVPRAVCILVSPFSGVLLILGYW